MLEWQPGAQIPVSQKDVLKVSASLVEIQLQKEYTDQKLPPDLWSKKLTKDQVARERTGHHPSHDKAKKMNSPIFIPMAAHCKDFIVRQTSLKILFTIFYRNPLYLTQQG